MSASKNLVGSFSEPNVNYVYVCLVGNITPAVGCEAGQSGQSCHMIDNINEEVGTSKGEDAPIEVQRSAAFHELIESCRKVDTLEKCPENIEEIDSNTMLVPLHINENSDSENENRNPKIVSLTRTKWLTESRDGSPDASKVNALTGAKVRRVSRNSQGGFYTGDETVWLSCVFKSGVEFGRLPRNYQNTMPFGQKSALAMVSYYSGRGTCTTKELMMDDGIHEESTVLLKYYRPTYKPLLMQSTSDTSSVSEDLAEHYSTHKALSTVLALDKELNLFGLSNTYIHVGPKTVKKMNKDSDSKAVFHQTAIVQSCFKTCCRRRSRTDLPASLKTLIFVAWATISILANSMTFLGQLCLSLGSNLRLQSVKCGICGNKTCGGCRSSCSCARCRSCASCTSLCLSSCGPCGPPCKVPCSTPCNMPCGAPCTVPCPLFWTKPCPSKPCPPSPGCCTPACSRDCPRFGLQVAVIKKPKYDPIYTEIQPKSSCVLQKPFSARTCNHVPCCIPPSNCFPYLMPCFWPARSGAPCSEPGRCFHNPPCPRGRTPRSNIHPQELCPVGKLCVGKDQKEKCENYSCIGRNNEALAKALASYNT